jgi:acylphosphatase
MTNPDSVQRDGKVTIGAKFEKSTAEQFKEFCRSRGESYSNVLRRLARAEMASYGFLPKEEAKGFQKNNNEEEDQ